MQRVYSAAHLPEAYLVRGLLAAVGIEARVLNEYATGGLGDLPADAVRPEVWIEDARDLPRARQIVDAYEQTPAPPGLDRCPACGEDSPRGFAICWKCLLPLPV
jgi:Putative prokaryotic signal transducing protein